MNTKNDYSSAAVQALTTAIYATHCGLVGDCAKRDALEFLETLLVRAKDLVERAQGSHAALDELSTALHGQLVADKEKLTAENKRLRAAIVALAGEPSSVDVKFSPKVAIDSAAVLAGLQNDPSFNRHVVSTMGERKRAIQGAWGSDVKGA